jgi:hypothetical protein
MQLMHTRKIRMKKMFGKKLVRVTNKVFNKIA